MHLVSECEFELSREPAKRTKRSARDPRPRFRVDRFRLSLILVRGCPSLQVPADHLARAVKERVDELDLSQCESKYSALGRRGYSPTSQLGVWVYASLIGVHESTKLGAQLQTDAALQFLSGGHNISSGTLRRFRSKNAALFEAAIIQCVALAHQRGLLHLDEGGVDSVRLRAHASLRATRTKERSTKRLKELSAQVIDDTDDEKKRLHAKKVAKHEDAVDACIKGDRTNVVLTNPGAGLIKFPYGASAPGHRVTVTAFGVTERIVTSVLIDADGNDNGKLGPSVEQTVKSLGRAGVQINGRLQIAADAGYASERDMVYALKNRDDVEPTRRATEEHSLQAKERHRFVYER